MVATSIMPWYRKAGPLAVATGGVTASMRWTASKYPSSVSTCSQSVSQSVIALRKAQLLQGDWSNTPLQVQSRKAPTLRRQLYSSCKRNAHSAKWWMQLQEICIHSKTHRVFGARVGRGCDKHLTEAGAYLGSCNSRSCLGSSSSSSSRRFCCGRNTTATACFHKQ